MPIFLCKLYYYPTQFVQFTLLVKIYIQSFLFNVDSAKLNIELDLAPLTNYIYFSRLTPTFVVAIKQKEILNFWGKSLTWIAPSILFKWHVVKEMNSGVRDWNVEQ